MALHPEPASGRTGDLALDWSALHSSAERSSLECSQPTRLTDPQLSIQFYIQVTNVDNSRKKVKSIFPDKNTRNTINLVKILSVTHLLGIKHNLLELSSLCKALNDFVGDIGSEIDTEGKSGVYRLNQVAKLLRALQLKNTNKDLAEIPSCFIKPEKQLERFWKVCFVKLFKFLQFFWTDFYLVLL